MAVLSPQYGEKRDFFSKFSVGGFSGWRILLVIPLELQERKHQPFPMTRSKKKHFLLDFAGIL